MKIIPLLSFFSGAGFLDLGFEQAGFEIVWANEIDDSFARIYRCGIDSWRQATGHNLSGTRHNQSRLVINRSSITDLTGDVIFAQAFPFQKERTQDCTSSCIFGMIGGPPCQDFTRAGTNLGAKGSRGRLTQVFVDLLCDLRPNFFLMKNVPDLAGRKHGQFFHHIIEQLEEGRSGYLTSHKILNALEYGVPQDRKRLFLIGFRKDSLTNIHALERKESWFPWPQPTHQGAKKLPWPTTAPWASQAVAVPVGIPLELTVGRLLADEAERLPNGREFFVPHSAKFNEVMEGDVSRRSFKRLHRYRYSPTACYGNSEVHLHSKSKTA